MVKFLEQIFAGNNPARMRNLTIIAITAALSLFASLVLSVEALQLAKNPDAVLGCDLSSVISCGTVARHESSAILGFPNSYVGMVAEPVFLTLAVLGLAGVKWPRWITKGAQLGATVALIFAGWMFYTSYFVIGALCPWCLVVSFSTLVMWFSWMRHGYYEKTLFFGRNWPEKLRSFMDKDYDRLLMVIISILMIAAIILKYA